MQAHLVQDKLRLRSSRAASWCLGMGNTGERATRVDLQVTAKIWLWTFLRERRSLYEKHGISPVCHVTHPKKNSAINSALKNMLRRLAILVAILASAVATVSQYACRRGCDLSAVADTGASSCAARPAHAHGHGTTPIWFVPFFYSADPSGRPPPVINVPAVTGSSTRYQRTRALGSIVTSNG